MSVRRWVAALRFLASVATTFASNEQPGVAPPLCHCADGQTQAALQRRRAVIPAPYGHGTGDGRFTALQFAGIDVPFAPTYPSLGQ